MRLGEDGGPALNLPRPGFSCGCPPGAQPLLLPPPRPRVGDTLAFTVDDDRAARWRAYCARPDRSRR